MLHSCFADSANMAVEEEICKGSDHVQVVKGKLVVWDGDGGM